MATQPAFNFDESPLPERVRQFVHKARKSGRLAECEQDVLFLLINLSNGPRVGRESAMAISAMQDMWRNRQSKVWSDRSIKAAVKTLLEQHDIPIGSSRASDCPGYFIITDESEAESTAKVYGAEIRSLARRCRALSPRSSAYVRELLGQVALEINT